MLKIASKDIVKDIPRWRKLGKEFVVHASWESKLEQLTRKLKVFSLSET